MVIANNIISKEEWEVILTEFKLHCAAKEINEKEEVYYIDEEVKVGSSKRRRFGIYDNFDRHSSPALEFIIPGGWDKGKLYVYNSSEQAHAPINYENGLEIAKSFFDYAATKLSESIVCDYLMS
jgi:hypothetical protein